MRDHDWMHARFLGIAELVEAPHVAVVVDVMRAFTVAAWAFAQGAEKIVLAESPAAAGSAPAYTQGTLTVGQ